MNNRIRTIRQSANMSMRAFGDRIGVSSAAVSKIETGVNAPSEQTIRAICNEFNINREWLEFGVGEMSTKRPLLPELIHTLRNYPNALEALATLTPDEWQVFENMLTRLIENRQK